PATCNADEVPGSIVNLTATPSPGQTFTGWSGCTSAAGTSCSVTMSSAKGVTATFSGGTGGGGGGTTFQLSIAVSGNGTVSGPGGIWCNASGGPVCTV